MKELLLMSTAAQVVGEVRKETGSQGNTNGWTGQTAYP